MAPPGGQAAKAATTAIPIVLAVAGDAVATGLVQSLARPGGNLTGSTFSFPELNAKRIEMLKEALPNLKRVAVLMNATNVGNVVTFEAMARTARSVELEVVQIFAKSPEDFEGALAQITKARAEAVVVYEDALFVPGKFDTVVNLRTAKTLRVTIPRKVLLRADTVSSDRFPLIAPWRGLR